MKKKSVKKKPAILPKHIKILERIEVILKSLEELLRDKS